MVAVQAQKYSPHRLPEACGTDWRPRFVCQGKNSDDEPRFEVGRLGVSAKVKRRVVWPLRDSFERLSLNLWFEDGRFETNPPPWPNQSSQNTTWPAHLVF